MRAARLRALVVKELLDVSRNPGMLLPVAIVAAIAIVMPFVIAIMIPAVTGQSLAGDRDFVRASLSTGTHPELTAAARVQFFLFQQFLLMFLLMPITGAMALAAHAVIGEKQARTLEPLLATPMTTAELLVGKVLGALLPTLAVSVVGLFVYFGAIALFAEPGVLRAMFTLRTVLLIGFIGPAAALVSLQSAVVISSRVNDARTAQQLGVLIVLPLTAVMVGQFTGSFWLSNAALALAGVGLTAVWVLLALVSVVVFDREAILTRWR